LAVNYLDRFLSHYELPVRITQARSSSYYLTKVTFDPLTFLLPMPF
jgi:hypothetical protein